MDLKGSIINTNLRIYPSKVLVSFLKDQSFDNAPINIKNILKVDGYKQTNSHNINVDSAVLHLTDNDIENLNKYKILLNEIESTNSSDNKKNTEPNIESKNDSRDNNTNNVVSDNEEKDEDFEGKGPYLTTANIEWLYTYLKEKRAQEPDTPYLHDLMERSHIELPPNEVIKRNPDLEARCVKLRAQQEAREYRKMTKGVDNVRMRFPEDSISYQLKQMNRQLIAIGQFIISIFAGFLFGFRGVEWMVGNLDFGFRLLLGVICALIIALAEIYFLAKKLNEELCIPETTQLGGPPKFADEKYQNITKSRVDKPHQD